MYKLFLCLRYLRKRRIAFFAVAAVALCVAILIVISSIFVGFIGAFHSAFEKQYGQLILVSRRPLPEYSQVIDFLEKIDGVQNAKPHLYSGGLLYFQRGDVRSVEIVGIDLARQCRDRSFRDGLTLQKRAGVEPSFELSPEAKAAAKTWFEQKNGRPATNTELNIGVIGGIGLFGGPDDMTDEYDKAKIADVIRSRTSPLVLTAFRRSKDRTSPGEVVRYFCWPVDAVQTGFNEADTGRLYLPYETLKNLIYPWQDGTVEQPAMISITGRPGTDLAVLKNLITEKWRVFASQTLGWSESQINNDAAIMTMEEEFNQIEQFVREIRKQLGILQLVVGFICLVAAFLVFAILHMIVMQKKRDIGILRSIGGSRSGLAGIFLGFGLIIGCVGAAIGLGAGVAATVHINTIESALTKILGFKIWKSGVYMFDRIPNDVAWDQVVWILIGGVAAAMLGAVWPAVRAARQKPVVTLRYE